MHRSVVKYHMGWLLCCLFGAAGCGAVEHNFAAFGYTNQKLIDSKARPAAQEFGDQLRFNQIHMRGTHNSYHLEPTLAFVASHRYSHVPLDIQLQQQQVRVLELDVHLNHEGFDVYHLPLIDNKSHCKRLVDCLAVMLQWSNAHAEHLPVIVWIENKSGMSSRPLQNMLLLEEKIKSVIPEQKLITPDTIRGQYVSLRQALKQRGWPKLRQLRGQFMFVLLNKAPYTKPYTHDFTSLNNRLMFARASASQMHLPWAGVVKFAVDDTQLIDQAVQENLLVAANICTAGMRDDDCFAARQQALAAGVHMLKDDFPAAVADRQYFLQLPGAGVVSCHQKTAPVACQDPMALIF